jgi:type 1 glutamine amidotransferase/dienelactone hydrolase
MSVRPEPEPTLESALRRGAWRGALLAAFLSCGAPPSLAEETVAEAKAGPYPVGVRTLVLADRSREDALTGGPRTLVTEIWYPAVEAARGGRPATFSEFFGRHQEAAGAFVERFGGSLEEVNRRFETVAVRDAGLRPGRYPLLVFSHGNGGVRHQNVFQMDHLASHGYVIASPDHTGNAGLTPLPERAVPYDRRGRGQSARDRPLDVSFIIDELLARDGEEGHWLRGAVDRERIGILGHSFGGFTACRAVESDPRVKAILPMTVAYGGPTSVPVLVMLAGRDRTMGEAGNNLARLYYLSCTGPKHLVTLRRGGHFSFTDMDRINPAFGDGIGADRKSSEEFLAIGRAKQLINAYSLAFFERYLRGDQEAGRRLALNLDAEEVEIRAENLASIPEEAVAAEPQPVAAPAPAGFEAGVQEERRKARVLLLTGDDVPAHDWRSTTPPARAALEKDGRLEVRVAEDPSLLETGALGAYDLVVLNYRNAPDRDPGPRARENLAAFVRAGGGLVALHFAVNAFEGWDEYPKMIGRIWVGRRAGQKVSGHGPRGPFQVRVAAPSHPITQGLGDFEADDELYAQLVGEAPIDVLLEASSDYSGKVEPIAWTLSYGKGRVFVTVLGHDARARSHPAFETLLLRGAVWAAKEGG